MKDECTNHPSRNLVDKNFEQFAHINEKHENGVWIRVQLPRTSRIEQIMIYNRIDCCQDLIVGLSVFIKMRDVVVAHCGTITSVKTMYTIYCTGSGDVVELSQDGVVGHQNIGAEPGWCCRSPEHWS